MTVDILIPSYNRAHFIPFQLTNLLNLREALAPSGIEINVIVSDNHSNPPVVIPDSCKHFAKVVRGTQFLNSGEENLISGLKYCTADYIWTLSDDDSPIIPNVVDMFLQIQSAQPDFTIGGSSAFLPDGEIIQCQTICSSADKIKTLPDFVQRTGFWFVLTGFSGLIVRRELIVDEVAKFKDYFGASKIYSFALFLLDVYWEKKFMFFGRPIVLCTQNDYGDNWRNMALVENVFHRYFWSLGFIRQLKILRARKSIPYGFFAKVIDQRTESRFHLLFQVCTELLFQMREDSQKGSLSRPMTAAEFDEVVEFLCAEETRMMLVLAPLARKQDRSRFTIKEITVARDLLRSIEKSFQEVFYVRTYLGWNIYFFDGVYRALPSGFENVLKDQLRDIAPETSEWQLVGETLESVEALCLAKAHKRPDRSKLELKMPFAQRVEIWLTQNWLYSSMRNFIPRKLRLAVKRRVKGL